MKLNTALRPSRALCALLFAMLFTAAALPAAAAAPRAVKSLAKHKVKRAAPVQPNIPAGGFFATDKARRGRAIQAAIAVDIPGGFHINSNRPLGKYAVPTVLRIEAPAGVRVSPVAYPRSLVRRFKFSDEQLAVYEGFSVMRFNVTVPANYNASEIKLRARLRYQSCNDDVCFPPANRDIEMSVPVVAATERVNPVNTRLFGAGGRRK